MTKTSLPVSRFPRSDPGRGEVLALIALVLVVVAITTAGWIHIRMQPLPNQWDDSVYASATYDWLGFIHQRGDLLRGTFWGAVYALPHYLPPLVFVTSLVGAFIGGETLLAMRTAHLFWLVILLLSAYANGARLANRWIGVLSALLLGISSLVFFWSQTIMGEPALFAAVGLLLMVVIFFGQKPGMLRGALIGGVTGLGLLTKQHFIVSALAPLALWGLWLVVLFTREHAQRKQIVLTLVCTVGAALLVAGPWYAISYRDMLAYASQPAFELHTLNQLSSWQAFLVYSKILLRQVGWPALLVGGISLIWGLVMMIAERRRILRDWRIFSIFILLTCALINMVVGYGMRNINTRFITPVFIPLSILTAAGIHEFLQRGKAWRWGLVGAAIALNLIFWVAIDFGFELPISLTMVKQDENLKPTNMALTQRTFETVEAAEHSSPAALWVVGNYHSFNQPTFTNLVEERKYNWKVHELYRWMETEVGVDQLLARVQPGDWVAIYRQERAFDVAGEELVSRLDDAILSAIRGDADFRLVSSDASPESKDEVSIFQRNSE